MRTSNKLRFSGKNPSGTNILNIESSAITDTTNWHHALFSVDMADTAKRHLYIDDVLDKTVLTYADDLIDLTGTIHTFGSQPTIWKWDGCMADVWFGYGQYIDFSIDANRLKFIDVGNPVDLGSDGSTPTGVAPLIFFSGATAAWHTNKGPGGGFTEFGALTDCGAFP